MTDNENKKACYVLFHQLRRRLVDEVSSLSRRANLNLIIGIITSITGIVLLSVFAVSNGGHVLMISAADNSSVSVQGNEALPLLLGYLPKLSLVLLIELFAFFFLKLYRYSLMEVKYFQNEITSCEIKMMGLVASIDSELKASVVDHFIAVERNFILKKDERTIDLAREEIEASTVKNFVDKIASLKASK